MLHAGFNQFIQRGLYNIWRMQIPQDRSFPLYLGSYFRISTWQHCNNTAKLVRSGRVHTLRSKISHKHCNHVTHTVVKRWVMSHQKLSVVVHPDYITLSLPELCDKAHWDLRAHYCWAVFKLESGGLPAGQRSGSAHSFMTCVPWTSSLEGSAGFAWLCILVHAVQQMGRCSSAIIYSLLHKDH